MDGEMRSGLEDATLRRYVVGWHFAQLAGWSNGSPVAGGWTEATAEEIADPRRESP